MEDRIRTDRTVILIVTISSLGLILKCLRDSWEFYIPLIAIGGTIGMWVLHIAQYADYRFREGYYLAFAMILAFFHGIHAQSFLMYPSLRVPSLSLFPLSTDQEC